MTNMTDDYDAILARELGKVTKEAAGPVADLLGTSLPGIDLAGSLGARMAMKYMPTERSVTCLTVQADGVATLRSCLVALQDLGTMLPEPEESPFPTVSLVVRSGFLNMNPAVVHVELIESSDASSKVQVSAAAKEGLIKQNTAAKAVTQVVQRLKQRLPMAE
jgi:hypothetical protein